MAFDLPDGGADAIGVAVTVVIRRAFLVFVVNSDWILFKDIRLLDDPAVSGTPGLDFVEVICLADEPEVGSGEKGAFLWSEHYCFLLPFLHFER